jgi:hypothetical protein
VDGSIKEAEAKPRTFPRLAYLNYCTENKFDREHGKIGL